MDPLSTIEQYADILINKSSRRPQIIKLLEAIKYCNRMIKFNIFDLRDQVNMQYQNVKIKEEWTNIQELFTETVNCNKLQSQRKR